MVAFDSTVLGPHAWPLPLVFAWSHSATQALKTAVTFAALHTGVPTVVVAAGALVVSYRFFKRAVRVAIEMTIAMTIVLIATKMGWIGF